MLFMWHRYLNYENENLLHAKVSFTVDQETKRILKLNVPVHHLSRDQYLFFGPNSKKNSIRSFIHCLGQYTDQRVADDGKIIARSNTVQWWAWVQVTQTLKDWFLLLTTSAFFLPCTRQIFLTHVASLLYLVRSETLRLDKCECTMSSYGTTTRLQQLKLVSQSMIWVFDPLNKLPLHCHSQV